MKVFLLDRLACLASDHPIRKMGDENFPCMIVNPYRESVRISHGSEIYILDKGKMLECGRVNDLVFIVKKLVGNYVCAESDGSYSL
jgi:hypothetical protein